MPDMGLSATAQHAPGWGRARSARAHDQRCSPSPGPGLDTATLDHCPVVHLLTRYPRANATSELAQKYITCISMHPRHGIVSIRSTSSPPPPSLRERLRQLPHRLRNGAVAVTALPAAALNRASAARCAFCPASIAAARLSDATCDRSAAATAASSAATRAMSAASATGAAGGFARAGACCCADGERAGAAPVFFCRFAGVPPAAPAPSSSSSLSSHKSITGIAAATGAAAAGTPPATPPRSARLRSCAAISSACGRTVNSSPSEVALPERTVMRCCAPRPWRRSSRRCTSTRRCARRGG